MAGPRRERRQRPDLDERFSLYPLDPEEGLRRLLGAELPFVESLATVDLDPERDAESWAALAGEQHRWLLGQVPDGASPVGEMQWEIAQDCDEPVPEGQVHYRFWQHHTRPN